MEKRIIAKRKKEDLALHENSLSSRIQKATFVYSADPLQSLGGRACSVGFCEDLDY